MKTIFIYVCALHNGSSTDTGKENSFILIYFEEDDGVKMQAGLLTPFTSKGVDRRFMMSL